MKYIHWKMQGVFLFYCCLLYPVSSEIKLPAQGKSLKIKKDAEKINYLGTDKEHSTEEQLLESESLTRDSLDESEETKRNEKQLLKLQQLKWLKQLNITEENDLKIMHSLVSKFKEFKEISNNEKENRVKLMILTSLEYLMHNIEIAREFGNINGVPDVIHPTLNHPWPPLRVEAAHVLAAAAENSPRIQIRSLETGTLSILMRIVLFDSDTDTRIYSMLAIRCILKRYPEAQAIFINNNGLSALSELFEKQSANHLLQSEIILLLHDTLQEHNEAMKYYTRKDKITQNLYKAVGLKKAIFKDGWCSMIPRALLVQEQNRGRIMKKDNTAPFSKILPRESQLRLVKIITDTLLDLVHICHKEFDKLNLKKIVLGWKDFYNDLVVGKYEEEPTTEIMKDNYFQTLKILEHLTREMNKFRPKDEL